MIPSLLLFLLFLALPFPKSVVDPRPNMLKLNWHYLPSDVKFGRFPHLPHTVPGDLDEHSLHVDDN